jgi:hypothetical protein
VIIAAVILLAFAIVAVTQCGSGYSTFCYVVNILTIVVSRTRHKTRVPRPEHSLVRPRKPGAVIDPFTPHDNGTTLTSSLDVCFIL